MRSFFPTMSYADLVVFIRQMIATAGSEKKIALDYQQINHYRNSLLADPLLEALLTEYFPYESVFRPVVIDAIERYAQNQQPYLDVHDPALASGRSAATFWITQAYPHGLIEHQQKTQRIGHIFNEIIEHLKNPLFSNILLEQEKQRQSERAFEIQKKYATFLDQNDIQPLDNIETLCFKYETYLEELRLFFISNDNGGLDEILCLRQWIAAAEAEKENNFEVFNRWGTLIEALDEARTAYFTEQGQRSLQTSCPLGVQQRLQDKIFCIMEQKANKNQRIESRLVAVLTEPFIQKTTGSSIILPTNLLYDIYLRAAGFKVVSDDRRQWVLHHPKGTTIWEEQQRYYIARRQNEIESDWELYLAQQNNSIKNTLRHKIARYLVVDDCQEFIDPALPSMLLNEFEETIEHIALGHITTENTSVAQALFQTQITSQQYLRYDSEEEYSAFEHAFDMRQQQETMLKMSHEIGFGLEHVELLLSLIGQSALDYSDNKRLLPGMMLLREYALAGLVSVPIIESHKQTQWEKKQAVLLYDNYLQQGQKDWNSGRRLISLLPDDSLFFRDMIQQIQEGLDNECQILWTNSVFKRLLTDNLITIRQYHSYFYHYFLVSGDIDLINILIKKGGFLHTISGYESYLYIRKAIHYGYEECAIALLQSLAFDVNKPDDSGGTLLMAALAEGMIPLATMLHAKGARLEILDARRENALFHAVRSGKKSTVAWVLNSGDFDLNTCNIEQKTPLIIACQKGFADIVFFLLSQGADVHFPPGEGRNCLMVAAQYGHLNLVQFFINKGYFNINEADLFGHTALSLATEAGFMTTVQELMAHGADTAVKTLDEEVLLSYAISSGNEALVAFFLDSNKRYDLQPAGASSWSFVLQAIQEESLDIVALLLQHDFLRDADELIKRQCVSQSLLNHTPDITRLLLSVIDIKSFSQKDRAYLCQIAIDNRDQDTACALVLSGLDVNTVVANKQHYLLQALSSQQWSLASEILDSPILQINQPTFLLEQALHLAIRFGAKNIARGLLERGAEIYWQDNEGVDAYMVAAGLDISQRYMITLLLEYAPVDMTRADNNGQTVVHYACGCVDRDDIVGMALAQGASLETPNNRDMTPLQIALREGAVRCAEKLLAAGVSYRRFQNLKRRYEHYDDSDDDDILLENLDFPNVLYQIDALGRHGTAHDLLAAVIAKRAAVVNLLLSTDCQKPLLPQGETLMMLAARQGDITTLKILSRFEAGSLEIINSDGQTALDVALSHGHQECWMYLRELSSRQILFTQRAVEGEQSKADLRLF